MVQDYRDKQNKDKETGFRENKDKDSNKTQEGKPTGLKCFICIKFRQ